MSTQGFIVARSKVRGWLPLLILPAAVLLWAPADWPRWLLMWLLAFAIFSGCKWLTWRHAPSVATPWTVHLAYFIAWPGLDAAAFLGRRQVDSPRLGEWVGGVLKTLAGALVFWGAAGRVPEEYVLVRCWLGMAGFALMVHFGFFHLLSCLWRALGRNARPLMDRPFAAVSLSEFWGRRWNTAFRDLTHRFLFQPLTKAFGPRAAILVGFAVSGLIHDLVISLPAGGGYGLPTLYFLLQGCALLLQRSPFAGKLGLDRGGRGWLFTQLVVVLPAVGLFHPPFLQNVVAPFMQVLGVP